MTERNSYETLEVTEDASFEEIQDARDRLMQQHSDDPDQREIVEIAYDAILMDRLRMRQEGKLKVPERIRFPERSAPAPAAPAAESPKQMPEWVQRTIDTPSKPDILWPSGLFLLLAVVSCLPPQTGGSDSAPQILQLTLAFGFALSLYFINRKEKKFLRALLLSLAGLVFGLLAGGFLGSAMAEQMANINLLPDQIAALLAFFFLWLISCFLR